MNPRDMMFDENNDQIVFIAKHKEWISVKKLLIDEYAKNEDVSLILSQIQKTVFEKSYNYAQIDTAKIDEAVSKYCTGKKKNFASVSEAFGAIKTPSLKQELLPACATPEHYPLAEQYFAIKMMQTIGYGANPDLELLQKIYPNLKIAKPRGNFGKKKKK